MSARSPLDAAQIAETIDTIGLLVASLSDRVDAQGRILEKIHQTATEARAAAFAAERATDWQRNAASINSSLERALVSPMARFREADGLLRKPRGVHPRDGQVAGDGPAAGGAASLSAKAALAEVDPGHAVGRCRARGASDPSRALRHWRFVAVKSLLSYDLSTGLGVR